MCVSLRAWRKLRDVLQNWLQTSAEDEQVEKHAVCEELKEVERNEAVLCKKSCKEDLVLV